MFERPKSTSIPRIFHGATPVRAGGTDVHQARTRFRLRVISAVIATVTALGGTRLMAGQDLSLGQDLFARQWRPNDPRCHGGDGLGPVYNATSCLDCHSQGAPGGGGPADKNVELISLVGPAVARVGSLLQNTLAGGPSLLTLPRLINASKFELAKAHPGFRDANSIVLHRFGVDPRYDRWRQGATPEYFGQFVATTVVKSQRNPPPLFGSGLIDALPDAAFEEEAGRQPPEIRGRVARTRDGRVGRFGWKAQVASLHDFVLTACANELGLEVPGHHQAASPLDPDAKAKGLDLTGDECDALVAYVGSLPPPVVGDRAGTLGRLAAKEGRRLFHEIGCAGCHPESLHGIQGIYSDLLLHDMGPKLSDEGSYYGSTPVSGSSSGGTAKGSEWRTPPLWGVSNSGPYLHDGRSRTLENAVERHGGQAEASARRFHALSAADRSRVRAFLQSLTAPNPEDSPGVFSAADVEEHAERRLAEAARHAGSKLHLAQSLEKMGQFQGALEFYREVVREAPDSPSGRLAAERITILGGSRHDPLERGGVTEPAAGGRGEGAEARR
jgi:CxxC motif-containing protein (DUF1111 family)